MTLKELFLEKLKADCAYAQCLINREYDEAERWNERGRRLDRLILERIEEDE